MIAAWSAVDVRSVKAPKAKLQATSTGFRPKRSATGPPTSAPIIMPNSPDRDDRSERRAGDVQLRRQRGRDEPHGLDIETIHEDQRAAHQRHEQLIAAERLLVDELPDIRYGCLFHKGVPIYSIQCGFWCTSSSAGAGLPGETSRPLLPARARRC